jgi:hypothetical protein
MQKYIGTKLLEAVPMTRGEYNEHRGWEPPEGEEQEVDGYHVVYPDGYESWSPRAQFEEAYITVPSDKNAEQVCSDIRRITKDVLFA